MDKLTVIQADRNFAADYLEARGSINAIDRNNIVQGLWDHTDHILRIAHFRLSLATPAPDSEKLREALKLGADQLLAIKQANDPDDADSYRSDDREGCLDFTFAAADEAEKALRAALGASA